jgi:hypothetical protein
MAHSLTHPGDFWTPTAGFGIHPTLIPAAAAANHMLHPNLIPNYKIPNIHAIMQYMGLNSLFNNERAAAAAAAANYSSSTSPQNLSINISTTTRSSSPQSSPVESPTKESSIEQ